jgi:hypothetical protein
VVTYSIQTLMHAGALNWATGETVAVKEIQLSNIPKGELGQIMVGLLYIASCALVQDILVVRNRLAEKFECTWSSNLSSDHLLDHSLAS